ncbi:hypothetical protein [Pseudoduganella flava]|uniref:TNase-like domain-containing protein n=1 Tax=Pseudoduganella flava TaxID=871742 RepID=A0ABX6FLT3_9BURK|nr:hypothetical protein [Pseudoduganella flava]QGZ38106.1 hypothetical protein GO485_02940 [Pseudoduganella flava]
MDTMATSIKSPKKRAAGGVQRDGRFSMTIEPQGQVVRGTTVRFGGVTVVAPKPEESAVKKQLAAGKRAVSQLKKVLVSPGVRLQKTPDTPIFRADPRDASLVVRVLNGRSVRGRFIQGQFVPLTEQ